MSKKSKNLTAAALSKLMENTAFKVALNDDANDPIEIMVQKRIGFGDCLSFAAEVFAACVNEDAGTYIPEARDFAIKRNILLHYTNGELPEHVDQQYELIYNTAVIEKIIGYIDQEQLSEVCAAIERKIQFALDRMLSMEHYQLSRITAEMEAMTSSTKEMLDHGDIQKLARGLAALDGLDEEKIVKAVLSLKGHEPAQAQ